MNMEETRTIDIISLDKIKESPFQGRLLSITGSNPDQVEASIGELATSIEKSGLMQPIIVRKSGKNFELIDGHRRVLALKKLGQNTIQAIVQHCDDKQAQVLAIIGNLQRKDFKPLELARAYRKTLSSGLFANQRDLSVAIGKHETYVGEILNMLKMDERILKDLDGSNGINDIRMLRAIRRAGELDKDGLSDAQWQLYTQTKELALTRVQVLKKIKRPKKPSAGECNIRAEKKLVKVVIPSSLINGDTKGFALFIKEKLNGLVNEYVGSLEKSK